jgi:fructan beta-fructosidase
MQLLNSHRLGRALVVLVFLTGAAAAAEGDLLVADFEGKDYGHWKVEGEAFGPGPARGTLAGQMPVSGYLGQGLVNSFYKGDGTTGTLTSPAFKIERPYLNFLIGGGGYAGETCINLLVGSKVVRTATGPNTDPGGSETLDWQSWDVRELAGKEAVIQIVDKRTGGWGHIKVDHIVQSERRRGTELLRRELRVDKRYLHLPVTTGAPKRRMKFTVDGKTVREFEIELAADKPQHSFFADVSAFHGKTLDIECLLPSDSRALEAILHSDDPPGRSAMYREKHRPQFHFTSRRGWLNDPNGLVYHDGLWHLFYQHNPYGVNWGNMHWAHATSRDLVHWQELPVAVYPRQFGDWAFSGSAVVDNKNTSDWGRNGKPPLVAAFTSTGRGECIVYSLDNGRTWTEFEGNPVVKHQGRDPRLLWHEPTKQWIMAVYEESPPAAPGQTNQHIAFYTSPDLKRWQFQSRMAGYYECPDLFELPIAESRGSKWVLYAADGRYALGHFDGKTFRPDGPKQQLWYGRFYAAQTFSNAPDGRRIQIGWGQGISFPEMPFNQQMTVPVELALREHLDGPRLHATPVKELAILRGKKHAWSELPIAPRGENPLNNLRGELLEVLADILPGDARTITLRVRGIDVAWDASRGQLACQGVTAPLKPAAGRLRLHVLADRGSLELFGNNGLVAMSVGAIPKESDQTLAISTSGGTCKITSLEVYPLRSAWEPARQANVP